MPVCWRFVKNVQLRAGDVPGKIMEKIVLDVCEQVVAQTFSATVKVNPNISLEQPGLRQSVVQTAGWK